MHLIHIFHRSGKVQHAMVRAAEISSDSVAISVSELKTRYSAAFSDLRVSILRTALNNEVRLLHLRSPFLLVRFDYPVFQV